MKALSIRQPWPWAIQHLGKRVENRKWNTHYRGDFFIHASQGLTWDELEGFADFVRAEKLSGDVAGQRMRPDSFERGGLVGVARLVDVVKSADLLPAGQRPWFFGPVGFLLADIRSFPLIPCKGALGFFDLPRDIEARAMRMLAA